MRTRLRGFAFRDAPDCRAISTAVPGQDAALRTARRAPRMTVMRSNNTTRLLLAVVAVLQLVAQPAVVAAASSSGVKIPGAPNCYVFPSDNVWNMRVDTLAVAPNSSTIVSSIG